MSRKSNCERLYPAVRINGIVHCGSIGEGHEDILYRLPGYPATRTDPIVIRGFADEQGPEHHNLKLSQRRAAAVKQALEERGVAKDNLVARGFGEEKLAGQLTQDASLEESRRVDMAQR